MRKIIVGAQVSMDGVMQAPGGPAGHRHLAHRDFAQPLLYSS
jgi:hypothetical protein